MSTPPDGHLPALPQSRGTRSWKASDHATPATGAGPTTSATTFPTTDRREWTELVQRVGPATALVTLPDLTAFRLWGPRVTRFSFVLSPLAMQELVHSLKDQAFSDFQDLPAWRALAPLLQLS